MFCYLKKKIMPELWKWELAVAASSDLMQVLLLTTSYIEVIWWFPYKLYNDTCNMYFITHALKFEAL